jgi:hypothetical protein
LVILKSAYKADARVKADDLVLHALIVAAGIALDAMSFWVFVLVRDQLCDALKVLGLGLPYGDGFHYFMSLWLLVVLGCFLRRLQVIYSQAWNVRNHIQI